MCPASGRNDSLTVVQRDQGPRSRGRRSEAWREEDGRWDQENKVKQGREERAVSSLSGLVGPWGHESRAPGCPLMGGAGPKQDACQYVHSRPIGRYFSFLSHLFKAATCTSSVELMSTPLGEVGLRGSSVELKVVELVSRDTRLLPFPLYRHCLIDP